MSIRNFKFKQVLIALTVGLSIAACQKLDRPEFGEIVLDPPPPPYSVLKNYFAFEDNAGDSGQFRMATKAEKVTYVEGVNGKAVQFDPGGYIVQQAVNDSIKSPGSFTLAFWLKGTGPIDGAEGLFSISHKTEFWGNLDLFLETWSNATDPGEAFLKVHMFNAGVATGKGEEWNEIKIPGLLNKWSHIAVTYNADSSQFSIYADGVPTAIHKKVLGGGAYGPVKFNEVNGMVIGTYQFQTDPPLSGSKQDWASSFNGAMDQFRFYNVALSESEVAALVTSKE